MTNFERYRRKTEKLVRSLNDSPTHELINTASLLCDKIFNSRLTYVERSMLRADRALVPRVLEGGALVSRRSEARLKLISGGAA